MTQSTRETLSFDLQQQDLSVEVGGTVDGSGLRRLLETITNCRLRPIELACPSGVSLSDYVRHAATSRQPLLLCHPQPNSFRLDDFERSVRSIGLTFRVEDEFAQPECELESVMIDVDDDDEGKVNAAVRDLRRLLEAPYPDVPEWGRLVYWDPTLTEPVRFPLHNGHVCLTVEYLKHAFASAVTPEQLFRLAEKADGPVTPITLLGVV